MMMGKLSTFSMGFDCDMPIETQRVEAQLQNQGQTVVSIVRSNLLLEEDGLKYYIEDVCEGMTEDEIGDAIKRIATKKDVKEKYNNYRENPTLENSVEYIRQLNIAAKDDLSGEKIDIYDWLQGGDLK